MAEDFRKLEIWQEANALAIEIYKLTREFPANEKFALADQIQRSATSIPANIAESCGRFGIKDKIQLLMVARGSIFETRSHLSIALGLKYLTKPTFDTIDSRYEVLLKRTNAFVGHLRQPTNQSTK